MIKKRQLKAKMIELYKKTPKTIKILLHSKANLLRFIANFLRFIKNSKTVRYFAFQISSLKADSRFGWPNNFYMFWSIFLLKKRKLPSFRFRSTFIFYKKEPQTCQFATYRRNALFEFLTPQTRQMDFPIFKVIVR